MIGTLRSSGIPRRLLEHVGYTGANLLGLERLARRRNRTRLLILGYHGVREDADPRRHWLLVARGALEQQIAFVARHYRCLTIDEALAELDAGVLREPTACVTFDDGYRNNLTLALPVLARFRVPATVYLTTGLIGTNERLWTTRLEIAFERAPRRDADLGRLGLGTVPLPTPAVRMSVAQAVISILKTRPAIERWAIIDELHAQLGAGAECDDDGAFQLMSWAEVRCLGESGFVTFGAHTIKHNILSGLSDEWVHAAVTGSMQRVAAAGVPLSRTFAYPNGRPEDFDERAKAAVRAGGGIGAVSTIPGLNDRGTDRFALRRMLVGGDMTLADFRARASGIIDALRQLRA